MKKHEYALMVVEKVGNEIKEVIVQEGEDKEQKLAEASNLMKKEFELLSVYHIFYFIVSEMYFISTSLHSAVEI